MKVVKVLVVDDSALVREVITEMLDSHPRITVVGRARNGVEALREVKELDPDVILLDLLMPQKDGLTTLAEIMTTCPRPVIVVSVLGRVSSREAIRALELGAMELVVKPDRVTSNSLPKMRDELVEKILTVSKIVLDRLTKPALPGDVPGAMLLRPGNRRSKPGRYEIIVIGSSTGGPQALSAILPLLPVDLSLPVVVAQHMPVGFTAHFAERLDAACALNVLEAREGLVLEPGNIYICPSGYQTLVERYKSSLLFCVRPPGGDERYSPTIDFLFSSVARHCGAAAIGVILTGMGNDGASGLLEMSNQGAQTIAQDEATSVIFGMPGVAVQFGAAGSVLPVNEIAAYLLKILTV